MLGTKIAIEKFLSIPLPAEVILPEGEPKFFVYEDIKALILERKPFFWIDKAVSVGNDFMLTSTKVTVRQCEGHFPGYPVVPLIEIFRLAAQTGLLLTALNLSAGHEPLAGGSGKNRSKLDVFIEAPVSILVEAKKTAFKMGLYFVDTKIYAHNLAIATAENIIYTSMPKSSIVSKMAAG